MRKECEAEIYKYAPNYRQLNAALYGEEREYVDVVLQLLRDHYHSLVDAGETIWSVPVGITQTLLDMKPDGWE